MICDRGVLIACFRLGIGVLVALKREQYLSHKVHVTFHSLIDQQCYSDSC